MPLGKILNVTKIKPTITRGKTFEYFYNSRNKTWVKFEKKGGKK